MTERTVRNILITGGAGFIGANLIHNLARRADFQGTILNVDLLTYAGNLENLAGLPVASRDGAVTYHFRRADIRDRSLMAGLLDEFAVDTVIHLAAESHVDRSILAPAVFLETNVMGTFGLLEACREVWAQDSGVRFHHVSTDEVFGALGAHGRFTEESPYDPRSPYSASKAASDHLVRAYANTYGLPVSLSHSANNYGPMQHAEKLIPRMIAAMVGGEALPVYGDGANVRDWLYVEDHAEALWRMVTAGETGAAYNVGGDTERTNLQLVRQLCAAVATALDVPASTFTDRISFIADRPGHDFRYATDASKLRKELGWSPVVPLEEGLHRTVAWYLGHRGRLIAAGSEG